MSKASEYAEAVKKMSFSYKSDHEYIVITDIYVNESGHLCTGKAIFPPETALKLAKWIEETFSDEPKECEHRWTTEASWKYKQCIRCQITEAK